MIILLVPIFMGLMTTGIMECAQKESAPQRSSAMEIPKRNKRDLATTQQSEEDKKHVALQAQAVQSLKRRSTSITGQTPLVIHLPPQEEEPVDMQVVDLRGQMEAQDIDNQRRNSWCDQLTAMCTGSRRRSAPLSPPPLQRQYSYYPGRLSPTSTLTEPGSPEPGSDYLTNQDSR